MRQGVRVGFGFGLGGGRRDLVRLFEGDSVAGLGEGELLDRFARLRDEAAFEALVGRLGPMVLGVCRRMLADPHDVEDAFQATFLVLVRKAASIRDRDLVAPWLYGVALKVARRARAEAARRRARERVAAGSEAVEDESAVESGWAELRVLIDEEIGRLPESHRRAVVLCDVEGLSREEAALRLGWSLNMVRGRLERGRGRLRGQLARRGVAPSGAWMALMVAPPSPPAALLASTVRAALAFSTGRMATGLASASAVALSQGVLRMMTLSKLKVGLAALVSASFIAGGSGMLAAQGPANKPGAEAAKVADPFAPRDDPKPAGAADPFRPRSAAELAKARVELARQRYQAQRAFYDEGRITVDRLVDASRGLMQAEGVAAAGKADRVAAARNHYDRLADILKKERAELKAGRSTVADVTEIEGGLIDAELALAQEMETPEAKPKGDGPNVGANATPSPASRPSLDQERVAIARRLYDQAKRAYPAEINLNDLMEAAITLAKAEEVAAGTRAERIAAVRSQVESLKRIAASTETLVKNNEKTEVDLDRVRLRVLDAEAHLLDVSGTPGLPAGPIIPKPGDAGPGPNPSLPPSESKPVGAGEPLVRVVYDFNRRASKDEVGREQAPLTEEEVIAAIRLYQELTGSAPWADLLVPRLRRIAATGEMPPDATIRFETTRDPAAGSGEDCVIDGWWIWIEMPAGRGNTAAFPVRSRVFRIVSLEAARDRAYAMFVKLGQVASEEARAKVRELGATIDSLEARIAQRKDDRAKKGLGP